MGWDQRWSWIVSGWFGHKEKKGEAYRLVARGGIPAQDALAGQANIERKRIAELRDRLRSPLTAQERDLTARELTRLEGELVKSLATG